MRDNDVLTAADSHEHALKYTVIGVQTRHIHVRMPFSVPPRKVNIIRHVLLAVLLADIALSVEVFRNLIPLFLRALAFSFLISGKW
jgi:hypothetical protein